MSWPSIGVAILHAALANGQVSQPLIADPPSALRSFRDAGRTPEVVVQKITGERSDEVRTLAIFRHREDDRSVPVSWRIRDSGAEGQVKYARSEDCPAVYGLIVELERIAMPQMEIRSEADGAPAAYFGRAPNIGPTHISYALAGTGFTRENEPVFFRIAHLGSGPIHAWWSSADNQLASCWRGNSTAGQ